MLHVVHLALPGFIEQCFVGRLVSSSKRTIQFVLRETIRINDLGYMVFG